MLCSVDGDDSDDTIRMCLICGPDDTETGDEDSVEAVKSVEYGEDYLDPRVWQKIKIKEKDRTKSIKYVYEENVPFST